MSDEKRLYPGVKGKTFIKRLQKAGLIPSWTRDILVEVHWNSRVVIHVRPDGSSEYMTVDPSKKLKGAKIVILSKGETEINAA